MSERFIDKFFESLHKSEFERKDKHESTDTFLLAMLSVFGSIGVYFLKVRPTDPEGFWEWSFDILAVIYGIGLAWATFSVSRSVWPRYVAYLGDPEGFYQFAENLQGFFVPGFGEDATNNVDNAVDEELQLTARKQYAQCAANNRRMNQKKLKWQTRAREAFSFAMIVILVNAVPTYFVLCDHKDQTSVSVTNWPSTLENSSK